MRECVGRQPPPFNASRISDLMKQRDPRFSVQRDCGCSFTQLCQVMEREGHLELRKNRDTVEVAGTRHPPLRPPPGLGPPPGSGERWSMG